MTSKSTILLGGVLVAVLQTSIADARPILKINGAVETEFNTAEGYGGEKETEIVLATVEVAIDAKINDQVDTHILLLYEEGEGDAPVMDEGTVNFSLGNNSSIALGKLYLPFGTFETNLVSDPLTLELGETGEVALMYNFSSAGFDSSLYVFNGDSDTDATLADGNNTDLAYGLSLGYNMEESFMINLGYLSNIADSDSLQSLTDTNMTDFVAGIAFSTGFAFSSVSINLEYIAALDEFQTGDLGGDVPAGAKPSTTLVDLGIDIGGGFSIGAGYHGSSDAAFLGLPESVTALALGYEFAEDTSLAFEYATANDYAIADGGTGESASQILFLLAAEF